MPLPAVNLTFDLLTPKLNQYVYRPRYLCDLLLVELAPAVTKILYSHGFLVTAICCDPDLFTTIANQHIYEPKYICDQHWVKFPSLVFETWCWQGFQDEHIWRKRESVWSGIFRTNTSENKMLQAPKVFSGRGIIRIALMIN